MNFQSAIATCIHFQILFLCCRGAWWWEKCRWVGRAALEEPYFAWKQKGISGERERPTGVGEGCLALESTMLSSEVMKHRWCKHTALAKPLQDGQDSALSAWQSRPWLEHLHYKDRLSGVKCFHHAMLGYVKMSVCDDYVSHRKKRSSVREVCWNLSGGRFSIWLV